MSSTLKHITKRTLSLLIIVLTWMDFKQVNRLSTPMISLQTSSIERLSNSRNLMARLVCLLLSSWAMVSLQELLLRKVAFLSFTGLLSQVICVSSLIKTKKFAKETRESVSISLTNKEVKTNNSMQQTKTLGVSLFHSKKAANKMHL